MKKWKQSIALFLAIVLTASLLASPVLASDATTYIIDKADYTTPVGTYTVDDTKYPVYKVFIDGSKYNDFKLRPKVNTTDSGYSWPNNVYTATKGGSAGITENGMLAIPQETRTAAENFYQNESKSIQFSSENVEDSSNTYLFFRISSAYKLKRSTAGYLIIEWSPITVVEIPVNTTALDKALQNIPTNNSVYQENDGYNGSVTVANFVSKLKNDEFIKADNEILNILNKKYSSFWALYQAALNRVDSIYPETDTSRTLVTGITDEQVTAASTFLNKTIASLISRDYVNATEFNEFLGSYTKTEQGYDVKSQLPLKQADYPAARWQAFEDAMVSGHALLDALYETDSETGAVTPSARNWGPNRPDENKPDDAITNETLASALTTIRTALSGLVSEDDLKSADDARSYIRKLNTMFPLHSRAAIPMRAGKSSTRHATRPMRCWRSIRLRRISRMMPPQARSELHTPIITKLRMV